MVRTKWSQEKNDRYTNYRKPVALNHSCLSKEEQEEFYDLLGKYRRTFILRDEIGTWPNTKVYLQVIDKSP